MLQWNAVIKGVKGGTQPRLSLRVCIRNINRGKSKRLRGLEEPPVNGNALIKL